MPRRPRLRSRRHRATSSHIALLVTVSLLVVGCGGGEDPTAPREVREAKPQPAPPTVVDEVDEESPSRGLSCTVQVDEPLGLCGAATDNYKASFNEDPDAPELRTWLALHELELDGRRYEPIPGDEVTVPEVLLRAVRDDAVAETDAGTGAADGPDRLVAAARITDGPADIISWRVGPQRGLWGVLLQLRDSTSLADEPVRVEIQVRERTDGPVLAATTVTYEHESAFANASPDSLERNGPAGRWHVAGAATATNLELGWE